MGWSYTHCLGGHAGPRQYLDALYTHSRDGDAMRIVRSALVRMKTYYAAAEIVTPTKRDVVAIVCLVKYNPRDREGWILGYKDMDETVGPCEAECPETILKLLTPTTYEYALQWRERCYASLAARRAIAAKPRPRPGQIICLDKPVRFRGGVERQRLHVISHPGKKGRLLFTDDAGGLYRITNIKNRTYTLLNADGTEVSRGSTNKDTPASQHAITSDLPL